MILSERFGSLQEHFLSWMPWGSPWCYPSYILEDCEWVNRKKQKFEAWESTIYLLNLSLWSSYLLCSQCRGESGTQISPRHHFRHSDAHDPRDEMCTIVLWILFIPFAKSSKNHVPYPTYVLFLSVCSHKRMVQHKSSSIHNINYRCNLPLLASEMLLAGSMSITHGKFLLSF